MGRHRLGEQAWVRGCGPETPVAHGIDPASADRRGGLWTSTWHPRRGSAWIEWCTENDWGARPFDVWSLTPHRSARVYVVASRRDARRLQERYSSGEPGNDLSAVDLAAASRDYDAVHLTEDGCTALFAVAAPPGWVCESTLWMRWGFVATRHIGSFPG